MRERQRPAASILLVIFQPLVQDQGVGATERWLSRQGYDLTCPIAVVAQDHVAVQVHAFRDRCPLEADKCCEPTGLVVDVGGLDYFFPYTVINRRAWAVLFEQFPGNCALREISDQVECSLSRRLAALCKALGPFLAL